MLTTSQLILPQTFELLTGNLLFYPKATEGVSVEDDHLAQMMEISKDGFKPELLATLNRSQDYFDSNGACRNEAALAFLPHPD